jgi:hypothetical protein
MKKSAFLLLVILFAALGCSDKSGPKELAETAVANHLSLLPETSHLLIYANVKALQQTPFGQSLAERFDRQARLDHNDEDYRRFKEYTGFVFERDVQEIWIGGVSQTESKNGSGGAIVRGQFDAQKIIEYAKKQRRSPLLEEDFDGHTIYRSENNRDDLAFCFLSSETVALGDEPWLKNVIRQRKSGKGVMDNSTMSRLIAGVPQKQYFWGIVDMGDGRWTDGLRKHGAPFKGAESLEKMRSLIFYADVAEKAELVMKGDFASAEEAELFADMLNGFKAMAKMMVSDDKEAIDMLNDIRIKTDGAGLQLTMNIDKDFFDKLEEKRQKFDKIEL